MVDLDALRAVFDGSREPALLLANGVVEYQNHAAAELLPGGMNDALREALTVQEPGEVLLAGRLVRPRRVELDGGTLVLFRDLARGGLEERLPLLLEELRDQLNNLTAALHLLTPDLREQDGPTGDYLAIMNRSLYRLLRLAQNAQLAQDMAGGEVPFRPAPLDLAGFCRELCDQVEGAASMVGWKFSYESELTSLPTTGDEALLRQLLLELAGNALRAAGGEGKAGARLTAAGRRAVLTVWDNGAGADLAAMEQPAFTPGPEGGLKLGLAAARYIAALHGGAVMVDSRPGEGTRVTVSLPIRKPEPGLVRSPAGDATGGFSPVLVALSGVLPFGVYRSEDIDD